MRLMNFLSKEGEFFFVIILWFMDSIHPFYLAIKNGNYNEYATMAN